MNDCVCGHPRYTHSPFHNGRCIGHNTEPVIIGLNVVGYRREPCTCVEYEADDGGECDRDTTKLWRAGGYPE